MGGRNLWGPIGLLLGAMLSLQFGAAIAKPLIQSIGPVGTTTFRICFASLILAVVLRPWREPLSRKSLATIGLYGVTLGFMNFFFFISLKYLPLGIAVALEFTGPLGLAALVSRKKIDLLWVGLAALGVFLLLPRSDSENSLSMIGIAFALCAAVCWALYILIGKRAGAQGSSGTVISLGMMAAMLAILPIGIVDMGTRLFDVSLWPAAILVGLLSSAIPYWLELVALKKIPTKTFGILMSMEPAIASISGILLLGEYLTGVQGLAVALIITASLGTVWRQAHLC